MIMKSIGRLVAFISVVLAGLQASEGGWEEPIAKNLDEADNQVVPEQAASFASGQIVYKKSSKTHVNVQENGSIANAVLDDGLVSSSLRYRSPRHTAKTEKEDSRDSLWPFGSRNGSDDSNKNVSGGDTCAAQPDCDSCTAHSSWCHWCEKQHECHSKGSVYGCFSGAQCAANRTVDPDDQHGCASHKTCGECATASHFCHWCGHDQACHAIGSVYGCTVGVDCFSNDRCKRKEPERIKDQFSFSTLKALPVAIITAMAVLICCCATACFFVASGVKGAYDDLADLATSGVASQQPLLDEHNEEEEDDDVVVVVQEPDSAPPVVDEEGQEEVNTTESSFVTAVQDGGAVADGQKDGNNEQDNEPAEGAVQDETDPLLATEVLTAPVSNIRRSIRPRRPRHMQRLYNACTVCYVITMTLVGTMVFCSIRYFPKVPVYNICNDNVAWKSIIDGMSRAKAEVDVELLASISNPNHISVALDKGTGDFYHHGKFAGNFTIPPFTAEAMSITDVLIIAHLLPDMAIAKEYYNKKLILFVNTDVLIRVPALADFTYEGKMEDLEVHVNEINDRSLCACPDWDEAKNHSDWLLSADEYLLTLPLVGEDS